MVRTPLIAFAFALATLTASPVAGEVAVPTLRSPVVDRAELLSERTKRALTAKLLEYERTTGHQVVVHTTPSLEGLDIESYSMAIAEKWRVGHAGLDNGVIFTIAPNERKLRIEVGYGLEGVIPDITAGRIVRDIAIPELRAGRPEVAVVSAVDAILAAARGEEVVIPEAARRRSERGSRGRRLPIWLWMIILFVAFGSRGLFFLPFVGGLGRRGGFGGGGFGGGGFGGGGGGFGGGGASGSW